MPRAVLRAALLLALVAVPPASAAESLGVTPASIAIDGVQRGETYVREVTLQNQFDTASTFTIEREGETGSWARVEPAQTLVLPPRAEQRVAIVLTVPADAPNGAHDGALRFVGAAKERPDGSGFALRYAVAVPLHAELGGPQEVRVSYAGPRATDVEVGTPPYLLVTAANEGNVRTTARAHARILDLAGAEVAQATNESLVRPGERVDLTLVPTASLPEGTYRVVVTGEGAEALHEVTFKVVPLGTLGKEGTLRYLDHEPVVPAGLPVRVSGVFENTGRTPIARARLIGEAWQGDKLVAVFTSDELSVAPGETAQLLAYFTSPVGGELRLRAHVVYDGFRSPDNEGLLVAGETAQPTGVPWALLGGVALVALLAAGGVLLARRRRG